MYCMGLKARKPDIAAHKNKMADHPVHRHSLNSTFVIHYFESTVVNHIQCLITISLLVSVAEQTSLSYGLTKPTNECALNEDSNQLRLPHSLIRVFDVYLVGD